MSKFFKYLCEDQESYEEELEEQIEEIVSKCKPFLTKFKPLYEKGHYLYRAFDSYNDYMTLEPRKNRPPRGMSIGQQNIIDDYFESKFGYRYRANALFASFNKPLLDELLMFTNKFLCFIEGDFDFIYSLKVPDMILFYRMNNILNPQAKVAKISSKLVIEIFEENKERYPWMGSLLIRMGDRRKWEDILGREENFRVYFDLLSKKLNYKKNIVTNNIIYPELMFKCDNYILRSPTFNTGIDRHKFIEAIYARL